MNYLIRIDTRGEIAKPVQDVWEVAGYQFGHAHIWGSILRHSEGHGEKISGPVCDSRTCNIQGMGTVKEKVIEFNPDQHTLAYEVVQGFPFFVKRAVNRWHLSEKGTHTEICMHAEIELQGFIGTLMGPLMKFQINRILHTAVEDLKYYIENGRPHPRKLHKLRA